MTRVFYGTVGEGLITFAHKDQFLAHLDSLKGQFVEVIVRKKRMYRSNKQNRYYFGVVLKEISDHTGSEPKSLHQGFAAEYLLEHASDHRVPPRVRSTTELDTKEFSEYVEKIKLWAGEFLGLTIPEPGEVAESS